MINWKESETKNAYRSLIGKAWKKWPFGRWRKSRELITFPLESYCHDLPAFILSSFDVRY
jgi:hypothetical protein